MTTTSELLPGLSVSRETLERLEAYQSLLLKWTETINLIARSTRADTWHRHILDAAQLFPLAPKSPGDWVDLGSGGGLPVIVLAIIAVEHQPTRHLHLIESDQRKSTFLSHVSRELGLPTTIHQARIEQLDPVPAALITARALAPVERLLTYAAPFTRPETEFLFLKGQKADSELTLANRDWHSEGEVFQSITDPTGRILNLRNVRRRNDG